jgi:CHAD domain-containing protein
MDEVKPVTGSKVRNVSGKCASQAAGKEPTKPADKLQKVRKHALRQLKRLVLLEPKVLKGDNPDAIHDMRVASRRLQVVLDLFYPGVQPKEVRRFRRKIRRCRRSLGEVRNCDVLIEHVSRILKRKRVAHSEAWMAVQRYLETRRAKGFAKAMRRLSKVSLCVLSERLKGHIDQIGLLATPDSHANVLHFDNNDTPESLPERTRRLLGNLWNAFQEQVARSQHNPRASVIHGVRIATKRLRYLLEVVREFEPPGCAEALGGLRRLQQHLGTWHDREVLEQVMIEMIARPDFLRDRLPLAMQIEKLIMGNRHSKKSFRKKYFRMIQDGSELQRVRERVGNLVQSPTAVSK